MFLVEYGSRWKAVRFEIADVSRFCQVTAGRQNRELSCCAKLGCGEKERVERAKSEDGSLRRTKRSAFSVTTGIRAESGEWSELPEA